MKYSTGFVVVSKVEAISKRSLMPPVSAAGGGVDRPIHGWTNVITDVG